MNAGVPTCPTCGGINNSPQATQCRFCGGALAPPHPGGAPGYGASGYHAPQGYGAPPAQPYGGQAPYGAAPGPYGGPPGPYGGPPGPYGGPPGPYGGPQPGPYGGPQPGAYPVSGFGGGQPFAPGYVDRSGWGSGWSAFFWVRIVIVVVVVGMSLLGACVSAMSH